MRLPSRTSTSFWRYSTAGVAATRCTATQSRPQSFPIGAGCCAIIRIRRFEASGEAVGLPKGIMGNSEVGHMNLGSGRMVPQGLTMIDAAIADGDFARNETLQRAIAHVTRTRGTLHLMGLLSDGCVHSSIGTCSR